MMRIMVAHRPPVDAMFGLQLTEQPGQWSPRTDSADVLHPGIETKFQAPAIVADTSCPGGTISSRPVVGLEHRHFQPAKGQQCPSGQPPDPGTDNHHMMFGGSQGPRAEFGDRPIDGIASGRGWKQRLHRSGPKIVEIVPLQRGHQAGAFQDFRIAPDKAIQIFPPIPARQTDIIGEMLESYGMAVFVPQTEH